MKFIVFIFITILVSGCTTARRHSSDIYNHVARIKHSSYKPNGIKYIIKKGDSLWRLSRKYGVSVNSIRKINRISDHRDLKIGQEIIIPKIKREYSGGRMSWPVEGSIVSFYGEKVKSIPNKGIDITVAEDIRVKAAMTGKVVFVDYLRGWGRTVILKHKNNLYTIYSNLNNVIVKEGESLQHGQQLASLGGCSASGCDFHFEVRKGYQPCNPLIYLNGKNKS